MNTYLGSKGTYSPFKAALQAAVVELTSTQAQQFYKDAATEFFHCFGEGLLFLIAGTVRLGQLTRDFVDTWESRITEEPTTHSQRLLTGVTPIGLLPPQPEPTTPKPNTRAVFTGLGASHTRTDELVNRMVSTVDESGKPKPKTARSGCWHQCNTNIVFGIDGKTVKELRAIAKEQGYKNISKLTKRELLGLLA